MLHVNYSIMCYTNKNHIKHLGSDIACVSLNADHFSSTRSLWIQIFKYHQEHIVTCILRFINPEKIFFLKFKVYYFKGQ